MNNDRHGKQNKTNFITGTGTFCTRNSLSFYPHTRTVTPRYLPPSITDSVTSHWAATADCATILNSILAASSRRRASLIFTAQSYSEVPGQTYQTRPWCVLYSEVQYHSPAGSSDCDLQLHCRFAHVDPWLGQFGTAATGATTRRHDAATTTT